MERRMDYGRTKTRRRTHSAGSNDKSPADARIIKLFVCVFLFTLIFVTKLLFPSVFLLIREHFTASVDYPTALAVLGEGISGERDFTAAVGQAFTHAFKGVHPIETPENSEVESEGFAETFSEEENVAIIPPDTVEGTEPYAIEPESSFSDAIISAFREQQDTYSDYTLPAGTTYEMPSLGISYAAPVSGAVTSTFGFREHPAVGDIKFHYGTDYAAEQGANISAFADGVVVAVGESAVLGKYIIISHDGSETKYAHCSDILAETGQAVMMGEVIAKSGDTGNATSPCLHFELIIDGIWVNPDYYLVRV